MSCRFNPAWLTDPEFSGWIREIVGNNKLYGCKLCHKNDLRLSDGGVEQLRRHRDGGKHSKIEEAIKARPNGNFFVKTVEEKPAPMTSGVVDLTDAPPPLKKLKMTSTKNEATRAEIFWSLDCILHNASARSNDDKGQLFKAMFPDSAIAQSYSLARSKFGYVIYGIADYFKDKLTSAINDSPYFSVSFDESLNTVVQKCQMDIVIKYWDVKKSTAASRYFTSKFMGHSTAEHLKTTFLSVLDELDYGKMVQISMDGPSVNHSFYKKIVAHREMTENPPLFDTGSCNLHVMHNGFKVGAKKTGWNLKEAMSSSYNLLNDSPARREDYTSHTGSTDFPKLPCTTRWTEDVPVATRLITIWPSMLQLVEFYESLCKSKRPKCKSYEQLVIASKDKLKVCQLHFFVFFAGKLKPFLTFYQSDEPLAPFMFKDLVRVAHDLMALVFKDDTTKSIKTLNSFKSVDLNGDALMLKPKQFNIGTGASNELKRLLENEQISPNEAKKFKNECKCFVLECLTNLQNRVPHNTMVLKAISFVDPALICESPSIAKKHLKDICLHSSSVNIITTQQSDAIQDQFSTFAQEPARLRLFSKQEHRLDKFYFETLHVENKYPDLANFLKLVFSLSHGQAPIERGFSHNKGVLETNMQEKTIVSKRIIKDCLTTQHLAAHQVVITLGLMKFVNLSKKAHIMDQEKKKEAKVAKEKSQLQLLNADILKVSADRSMLVEESTTFRSEARELTKKGSYSKNFIFIRMAVDLDKKADANEKKIKILDETLKVMIEKKKSILSGK